MAADVLLRAGMLLDEPTWIDRARVALERLAPTAAKAPHAFGRLLAAIDFYLGRPVELAVIGSPGEPQVGEFLEVVRSRYLPNRLVAVAPASGQPQAMPLLRDRRAIDGRVTAYLCEGFVCQAPTTDRSELARQLEAFSARRVAS